MPGGRECIDISLSMGLNERPVGYKVLSSTSNLTETGLRTGLLKKHPYFCRDFPVHLVDR